MHLLTQLSKDAAADEHPQTAVALVQRLQPAQLAALVCQPGIAYVVRLAVCRVCSLAAALDCHAITLQHASDHMKQACGAQALAAAAELVAVSQHPVATVCPTAWSGVFGSLVHMLSRSGRRAPCHTPPEQAPAWEVLEASRQLPAAPQGKPHHAGSALQEAALHCLTAITRIQGCGWVSAWEQVRCQAVAICALGCGAS